MARRDSLGEQFNTVIGKRIRQMTYEKTLTLLKGVCHDAVAAFQANREFYNITGNTITSFSVGLFYKGKRVYAEYLADEKMEPTRPTLRKGEKYDLPEYYDGHPVDKPYTGTFGHGGQWGPTLGKSRLSRAKSRVRDTWNIVAVCPVEYAKYNQRIFSTMYNTFAMFPDLFSANVFYARSQNYGK